MNENLYQEMCGKCSETTGICGLVPEVCFIAQCEEEDHEEERLRVHEIDVEKLDIQEIETMEIELNE